jgi:hypothetical protein
VLEQQLVDGDVRGELGVDVQDADLAVGHADDADDRAVVLGQPRLPRPHAVPQLDPVLDGRHVRLVDVAVVLRPPRLDLQGGNGVDVTSGDRADGHAPRFCR